MILKIIIVTLTLVSFNQALNFLRKYGIDEDETPFNDLPKPEDLVLTLSEETFEDYLDFWLKKQYETFQQEDFVDTKEGCTVHVNTLTEPQPVFAADNSLKSPTGITGNLIFEEGEVVTAACKGNNLVHPLATQNPVQENITCQSGTVFSGSSWLSGSVNFSEIICVRHVPWVETKTSTTCGNGQGFLIDIAVQTDDALFPIMTSCFKESTSEVLYTAYEQRVENKINQVNVDRPNFQQGKWYPGLKVDNLYTQTSQKSAIATIVGPEMANIYINNTFFLARGHLAAKTDFILAPSQRATFTFINVAPQWQPFNGGNWNILEQSLRNRIGDTGKNTIVFTGTWDILKLKDASGTPKEIFLSPSDRQLPVPLWYFKVVYEPTTSLATAYVGLNNPNATLEEAKNLAFCTDVCRGNSRFSWLNWRADDLKLGYSLCCDVNEFKRTVNTLPAFTVNGILD